jgi:LysM repeat protein
VKLQPMRYKDYVWPHNPKTCEMTYKRNIAEIKIPFGGWVMQDMGKTGRILSGEGEFTGEKAYEQFKELAAVFEGGGTGVLVHPVWQITNALFSELTLAEEPRENYVRYYFVFREDTGTVQTLKAVTKITAKERQAAKVTAGKTHIVVRGNTMWGIAVSNGMTLSQLISLNPQISNPNLIYPGEIIYLSEAVK